MIDLVAAIRADSERFGELISGAPLDGVVPSCPDWRVADLAWHLTEVQHFWGHVVAGALDDPGSVPELERPADASLPRLFVERSRVLIDALERVDPATPCWSWSEAGGTVAWVRRRQAHEALIHRVDAELAGGGPFAVDAVLAADGVDEMIRSFLDVGDPPEWAVYEPDGSTARIVIDDGAASWEIGLGRFKGTSPRTGTVYDIPAAQVLDGVAMPSAVLSGTAVDMDLWLWGRGPIDGITVVGDPEIAGRLRATAADSTQ